jgi:hypothetical protein
MELQKCRIPLDRTCTPMSQDARSVAYINHFQCNFRANKWPLLIPNLSSHVLAVGGIYFATTLGTTESGRCLRYIHFPPAGIQIIWMQSSFIRFSACWTTSLARMHSGIQPLVCFECQKDCNRRLLFDI